MANPWDIVPAEVQGDPDPTPLYTAVGVALTAWERLEYARANIFGVLVRSRRGSAERAFGTIQSPAGRADMILAAAKQVLYQDQALETELQSLMTEIEKLAGRRNDIAHGVVTKFSSDGEGTTIEHGHYLVPAYYNTRKMVDPTPETWDMPHTGLAKYAYTAAQVLTYADHFGDYRKRCNAMRNRISTYCDGIWPLEVPRGIGA